MFDFTNLVFNRILFLNHINVCSYHIFEPKSKKNTKRVYLPVSHKGPNKSSGTGLFHNAAANQRAQKNNKANKNLLEPLPTAHQHNASNRKQKQDHHHSPRIASSMSAMPSLNAMIGSAQDTLLGKIKNKTTWSLSQRTLTSKKTSPSLPLATAESSSHNTHNTKNNYYSQNDAHFQTAVKKNSITLYSPKPANYSSNASKSFEYAKQQQQQLPQNDRESSEDFPYSNINQTDGYEFSDDWCQNREDRLTLSEISKIECFYNSMGCYVYVCRSLAELYQLKKEDEFDSIDNDPVNDYHEFMKQRETNANCRGLTSTHINGYWPQSEPPSRARSSVSYMYINSGVPVIVFNYGVNPKRKKDLRVLLAERATGFCMFEFKFDCITKLVDTLGSGETEASNEKMTVIQLKLNEPGANATLTCNSSQMSQVVNAGPQLNYHNEYFERFFNSKNRHAHKEHLLKFICKRGKSLLGYEMQMLAGGKMKKKSGHNSNISEFINWLKIGRFRFL